MQKFVSTLALVGFVVACSVSAFAANAPGLGNVGAFSVFIRNADALKALKLTADQEKQFAESVKALKAGLEADPSKGNKTKAEFTTTVRKLLTPDQLAKAQALVFQASGGLKVNRGGAGAAGNLFSLEALNLTPDQKKAVQGIQQKSQAAVKEAGDSDEGKKKAEAIRTEQVAAVAKLLTPDQKKLADKLTAETPEFLLPKPAPKKKAS